MQHASKLVRESVALGKSFKKLHQNGDFEGSLAMVSQVSPVNAPLGELS